MPRNHRRIKNGFVSQAQEQQIQTKLQQEKEAESSQPRRKYIYLSELHRYKLFYFISGDAYFHQKCKFLTLNASHMSLIACLCQVRRFLFDFVLSQIGIFSFQFKAGTTGFSFKRFESICLSFNNLKERILIECSNNIHSCNICLGCKFRLEFNSTY